MMQFSKICYGFTAVATILVLIFIAGIVGLSAQTTQDGTVVKDKSSNDATKKDGLFGSSINLEDLNNIGGFLVGIAAILTLIFTLIFLRRQPPIQILLATSEDISKFLKDERSNKSSRVEKVVQNVERNRKASFVDKAIAHAYRLQADNKINEACQKWQDIANYAEGDDNDLAARAWFSVGYLFTEQNLNRKALTAYDRAIRLNPDYAEAYNNRGAAKNELDLYDEAIADFDKSICLNSNLAEPYTNRGYCEV